MLFLLIVVNRWVRTESCLNLNLSRDLLQALSMCLRLQKLSQPLMEHLVSTGLPHLAKLSGVASVLVPALTAQAITPLGTLKIVAFQAMSFSSSSRNFSISPWKPNFATAAEL